MSNLKGFATGLLTGATIGGLMGMALDPLKDKESKKMRQAAGDIVDAVSNVASEMKK